MKSTALSLSLLAASALGAGAAITAFGDSTTFDYLYEMDTAPNNQDLDGNGTDDWWDAGIPTVSSGFAANTADNQIYRGDFNGVGGNDSIWREVVSAGAAADWTLEVRVARTNQTLPEGANGWFGIAVANLGESNSAKLELHTDYVTFGGNTYLAGTTAIGDGTYNTYRIAHDAADNEFYVWVNNTLLNPNLSTPLNGANGSAFDNSTFIGDYTGGIAGDWSIDYIRLDNAALGIPEPTAALLLGLGSLGLLRRRR